MSVYLDTCIVIYVVERHQLYSASIETLMRDAGAVDFCYTPLVRLECLVMPFRTNDTALLKLYEAFLGAQRLLDLPSVVFDEAELLVDSLTKYRNRAIETAQVIEGVRSATRFGAT
jgi:uncharacterized protein